MLILMVNVGREFFLVTPILTLRISSNKFFSFIKSKKIMRFYWLLDPIENIRFGCTDNELASIIQSTIGKSVALDCHFQSYL